MILDSDYDKFVDDLLIEERSDRTKSLGKDKQREMSDNPKDHIKGNPVISVEDSKAIDDYQKLKNQVARFRHTHGLQKYKMDEIKVDGDKLIIDEQKYQERIDKEKKLIENHNKIERESTGTIPFKISDLPQFDAKRGFKPYDKEKWEKEGKVVVD
jgi:hypothetical protein